MIHPGATACGVGLFYCDPSIAWTAVANYYFNVTISMNGTYGCGNGVTLQVAFDSTIIDTAPVTAGVSYLKSFQGIFTTLHATITAGGDCNCVR